MLAAPLPAISIDEICRRGHITGGDVGRLRRLLLTDEPITDDEVRALFRIDRACRVQDSTWRDFYLEAVTGFLIDEIEPRGYLTKRNADWLIGEIGPETVATKSEIELLVALLDRARWSPESLVRFALRQVLHAVRTGLGPLRGTNDAPAGLLPESDIELIRRILYAYGGDGCLPVTRAEAEVLLHVDAAVVGQPLSAAWADLLAKAIVSVVMAASGFAVPIREQALRREAWPAEGPGLAFADVLACFHSGVLATLYRAQSSEERALARLERQRNEIITNEEVTQGEVDWLAEHLGRAGEPSAAERLAIAYLEREGPTIHPALDAVVRRLAAAA